MNSIIFIAEDNEGGQKDPKEGHQKLMQEKHPLFAADEFSIPLMAI